MTASNTTLNSAGIRRVLRIFAPLAFLAAVWPGNQPAWAGPTVGNVRASQRTDGSGMVDIYYDLSGGAGPMMVSVLVSNDAGQHWNIVPTPSLLAGDVGPGVVNGANHHITWDAARDRPEVDWPQCKARVTAGETGQVLTLMLPGGIPLEMVRIPVGTFMMGSQLDPGYSEANETPAHMVSINYDFYLGKYEVTQEQWYAVMGSNPSYFVGVKNPVEQVNWNECQTFVTNLNSLGLGSFRLPSEAEWEYACRAGSSTRWCFGDNETELVNYAWYSANAGGMTHVVGQKLPSAFDLYDMHGNVYEWVQDWYHGSYTDAPADGSAWELPISSTRVGRGGSYWAIEQLGRFTRCAHRAYNAPASRYSYIGVRISRSA